MAEKTIKPVLERALRMLPPATIIVDKDGRLTHEAYQFFLNVSELLEALRKKAQTP